ncbi:MAG TPA: cation-transporting P-type ATPase, partial [Nitrospiria bacterium]|nr:cation-transporting P-type ATPase [Nitrospiria bacterium]
MPTGAHAARHRVAESRPAPTTGPDHWHRMEADDVLHALKTSRKGLSSVEAEHRLTAHGLNALPAGGGTKLWAAIVSQLEDVMIVVLLGAAVIAWAAGDMADAALIAAVVVINLALGLGQHLRAERAVAALRELEEPVATVRRDGRVLNVPSVRLVPGDLVLLEAGDRVPADGRLLEAVQLRVDESSLTGESVPADKHVRRLQAVAPPLGDRTNMAYMGTTVAAGRGAAVVTETGLSAELGRIAGLLQTVEEPPTPLQRRLNELGKRLALATVILTSLVFAVGV